ncbi:unnamed protein product [Paramecium sonneborni]|uniref:EGF-like domain-containing protein n=1 Tax=Paramecium sonneborni TaxID=65129 RepID=A0A8S1RPF0_9CILI|nr:unnamed protein product [Paramecium sonneborni]
MSISVIYILISLFQNSNSQWINDESFLEEDKTFIQQTGQWAFTSSGYFILPSTETTANFITCTTPATSYITLTNSYPSAESQSSYSFNKCWISMDLYFQGTWSSETVQYKQGSFTYSYSYTSPTTYSIQTGFCDALPYEVRTVNFTIILTTIPTYGKILFTSTNTNTGLVSIKNIYVSKIKCYPSCSVCTDPEKNQCTSCYYGLPTNNICPPCPSNQYYWKYQGCKDICDIDSPLYSNGFCQYYPINKIDYVYFTMPITYSKNLKWSLIYDQQNVDTSPTIIQVDTQVGENTYIQTYIQGVFKFNSGIYRCFKELSTYSYKYYLIGLKISIVALNDFPINCGIQFKINNTYFGSIYRNASGIQTHKLIISQTFNSKSYSTYSNNKRYDLITYVDIPKYQFVFSAIGNYTDGTAGWGMTEIKITSGYCPQYCTLCEVAFKCKTCYSGYYYYRDGRCISGCSYPYQKFSGSYCYDYDDETPYSQYLIQEHINEAGDPEQYTKYTLISQNGKNFLKASDIYFSYQQGIRIFGGPFVWAQAKFQRIHNIITPHHGVTIAFYILYGPTFPSDGQFIYSIENNTPVIKSTASYGSSNSDGTKQDRVYEKIIHNTNTLTITWECFGPNNEPVKAYCGFYNYYIAVHNCKPYCLSCTDQNTCTSWNSTYDANIVKFSQAECLINQYHDKESVRCLDCPLSCLSCTSKINCQSCSSTYTLTKLGCICTINQYEDSNQCFNCPIECNQCLSFTYCIECLIINNRQLLNGQCNCIDGYYPIALNPQCQLCHQFCKTCNGPTSDECLTCNNIVNIEQVGSTCRCPTGSYLQDAIKTCSVCHSSCLTCFRTTIDGCLTCDPALNRILKGLKCTCAPGYYELNNICTSCPNTEDVSLSQCYKQCNNNQLIWHTITCNSCDSGFQLVSGECQPICGNTLIQGYEQCEDNNNLLDDLCYNCQFQCPIHCLTCDQSTTLSCPDVCGDGIITGVEECEDGNTIQYDGCFNCKYQCQPSCTKCIKGLCFECTTLGWYIDPTVTPWQCKERCGDQEIVGSEQCDDGNTSDLDGCKDCKYFCRIGCTSCDYTTNKCLSCEFPGFVPISYYCKNVCGDGLVVTDPYGFFAEQCDDGNTINGDGCNSQCQFQCQSSSICTSCISNRCEICETGYYLSNDKVCLPICGDSNLVVNEQCENSFILPYKGCINCQAKCQSSCLTCSTSGLGCLSCKDGYNRIDNLCHSICGDQIITENEQCDDGNLKIGDGCHFCQFSCQDSCLNCIKGVCYDCLEGYQLISFKCYPICNEQCEMINKLQIYQRCKSCQFPCDLNCYFCQFGICQQCNEGYELSQNQQYCIKSLYYNSMIIENCQFQIGNSCIQCEIYAQLDNIEQKCNLKETPMSFCQYQLKLSSNVYCSYCFDYCETCNQYNCISCLSGYYLDDNFSCISFCGDGILAHDEQCEMDDQNCLSCMFDVPKFCELYFQDNCQRCENGYYVNQYTNICESKCGDGIIAHDEDCEYNNYIEFDGCYNCKYTCSQQCLNCINGVCQQCNKSSLLFDGLCYAEENEIDLFHECELTLNDECLICQKDYKLNQYGICISESLESCIQYHNGYCLYCAQGYELYENICNQTYQCQKGLYYNQELQICESSCGDGLITGWEECDDQNMQQYDGCYECKFECDNNCIQCLYGECYQCSQEFNLIQNKCLSKCQEPCLNCIQGVCYLCSSGYFLNEYFDCIKITCEDDFSCTSECGNGIIEDLEQCDDQNLINDDSCNNQCEQTCDINCIECIDSVCCQCKEGWRLGLFFCEPICGDQIIVGNEECDDGNQYDVDTCLNCKYQCPQHCNQCAFGVCTHCVVGFYLDIVSNSCNSVCGDKILASDEVCDDGNELRYDGCFQCQHQCQVECLNCQFGQCMECETPFIVVQLKGICETLKSCQDQIGFYNDNFNNDCQSQCGDGIVVDTEQCDDQNDTPYDGCYELLVFLFVEMELLLMSMRIVMIKMINHMMDVLSANFNVFRIVKFVKKEYVYNVIQIIPSRIINVCQTTKMMISILAFLDNHI